MRGCMRFCLYLYMHALRVCMCPHEKIHVMKPCRFESKFCSFVVIANVLFLFVWCNAALWYRFYLTSKKKLCHARCTYFVFVFTSTCIGRKKIKILHVAKPYRNGSFVVVTNMLPLSTQTRANVNRVKFELKWSCCLSFLPKCFPEHTNVKCVRNILSRAKMEDVSGCADWVRVLFVCVYAVCAARARVGVCPVYAQ